METYETYLLREHKGFITIICSPKALTQYKKNPGLNDLQLDIWPLVGLLSGLKNDLERELMGCNHLK